MLRRFDRSAWPASVVVACVVPYWLSEFLLGRFGIPQESLLGLVGLLVVLVGGLAACVALVQGVISVWQQPARWWRPLLMVALVSAVLGLVKLVGREPYFLGSRARSNSLLPAGGRPDLSTPG